MAELSLDFFMQLAIIPHKISAATDVCTRLTFAKGKEFTCQVRHLIPNLKVKGTLGPFHLPALLAFDG